MSSVKEAALLRPLIWLPVKMFSWKLAAFSLSAWRTSIKHLMGLIPKFAEDVQFLRYHSLIDAGNDPKIAAKLFFLPKRSPRGPA